MMGLSSSYDNSARSGEAGVDFGRLRGLFEIRWPGPIGLRLGRGRCF